MKDVYKRQALTLGAFAYVGQKVRKGEISLENVSQFGADLARVISQDAKLVKEAGKSTVALLRENTPSQAEVFEFIKGLKFDGTFFAAVQRWIAKNNPIRGGVRN